MTILTYTNLGVQIFTIVVMILLIRSIKKTRKGYKEMTDRHIEMVTGYERTIRDLREQLLKERESKRTVNILEPR